MWINQIICSFIGLFFGLLVSGGIFALITSIGIVPRLAGKTHTGNSVKKYELSIAFGGILGNVFYIYNLNIYLGVIGAGLFGIFSGMFIGCLATALAETINTTAIFSRRLNLICGLGFIILSLAMGKVIGSMMYFYNHWF